MTMKDAIRIALLSSVVALLAAGLYGCGPPAEIPNGVNVGPLLVDEPPELNIPLSPLDRMEQLQAVCCEIRLRWHEMTGWEISARVGAAEAGKIRQVRHDHKAPTLGEVIMKVKP